jgi:hypothetical protein
MHVCGIPSFWSRKLSAVVKDCYVCFKLLVTNLGDWVTHNCKITTLYKKAMLLDNPNPYIFLKGFLLGHMNDPSW